MKKLLIICTLTLSPIITIYAAETTEQAKKSAAITALLDITLSYGSQSASNTIDLIIRQEALDSDEADEIRAILESIDFTRYDLQPLRDWYDTYFTLDELEELLALHQKPIYQKVMAHSTELMSAIFTIAESLRLDLQEKFFAAYEDEEDEEDEEECTCA